MAELVDALASGASFLTEVEVQVLFWAPLKINNLKNFSAFSSYLTIATPYLGLPRGYFSEVLHIR